MKDLRVALERRRHDGLYRKRHIVDGPQRPHIVIDGKSVVSFCSNDYLGLAAHPEVVATFQRAVNQFGVGSGASHLITGHFRAHHALEEEIADFMDREQALLFSTGYMANIGIASALLGRHDAMFEDRLNHASLLDAGLISGARMARYAHCDMSALQTRLRETSAGEKLIATDGVFSMDGDIAPLPQLATLAVEHGAWLMADDAHGLGVLGAQGKGTLEHHGLSAQDVPILMGTLGKALGTFGAFVAGSRDLIETLIHKARSYIYTTAVPPAIAEATRTSLRIIQREHWRRDRLQTLIQRFRAGAAQLNVPLLPSQTAIQPLVVGDSGASLNLSQALLDRGVLVPAIRPPTVPKGTARLRITLSAEHTEGDIDRLLGALERTIHVIGTPETSQSDRGT